jgi:hypothetical protein
MSQSTLPEQALKPEPVAAVPVASAAQMHQVIEDSEYHYRPIPVLAPASLFLGLTALITFATPVGGILVGICGLILGTICFIGILRNRTEVGGFKMTAAGLILSFASAVYGTGKLSYDYNTEVPEGYRRVNFYSDISKKEFQYNAQTGVPSIHPDVMALDQQKIFLKGFMYPTRRHEGITEFVMVKDNQQCCFGGEPQITDMIYVKLDKPLAVNYSSDRVAVAGVFSARREIRQVAGLMPIYELKAKIFSVSKTMF